MSTRTAPYKHTDGSPCWTKDCSRNHQPSLSFRDELNQRLEGSNSRQATQKFKRVFRTDAAEVIAAPTHKEDSEYYAILQVCDSVRPDDGRVSRQAAVFAAPSVRGIGRWVKALTRGHYNKPPTRELTVDPENVYVYSIDAWEDASFNPRKRMHAESYIPYWESGIPLAQWDAIAAERNLDPTKWEVLLPTESMYGEKPVSSKRIITAQPEDSYLRSDLMALLEHRKFVKGIKW